MPRTEARVFLVLVVDSDLCDGFSAALSFAGVAAPAGVVVFSSSMRFLRNEDAIIR